MHIDFDLDYDNLRVLAKQISDSFEIVNMCPFRGHVDSFVTGVICALDALVPDCDADLLVELSNNILKFLEVRNE